MSSRALFGWKSYDISFGDLPVVVDCALSSNACSLESTVDHPEGFGKV